MTALKNLEITVDAALNWGVCKEGGGDIVADLIEDRETALIFAASYELLAACKGAENWLSEYETGPDTGLHGLLSELRATIAKAEA